MRRTFVVGNIRPLGFEDLVRLEDGAHFREGQQVVLDDALVDVGQLLSRGVIAEIPVKPLVAEETKKGED